jgi:hypothetical protein
MEPFIHNEKDVIEIYWQNKIKDMIDTLLEIDKIIPIHDHDLAIY